MKPKNLHVGTWACEMARWVKGLPEFSLGNPHAGKRRTTPVSWPPHTAHVTLASPQYVFYKSKEERATVALGTVFTFLCIYFLSAVSMGESFGGRGLPYTLYLLLIPRAFAT